MATIRAYTTIEQSRKLAEILPLESADQTWVRTAIFGASFDVPEEMEYKHNGDILFQYYSGIGIPCWSLAALMKILHRNEEDIVSLSYGGYKDGEYILNWCLDYEFEDGDYKKTFSDNPVDACVTMIIKLHELNLL